MYNNEKKREIAEYDYLDVYFTSIIVLCIRMCIYILYIYIYVCATSHATLMHKSKGVFFCEHKARDTYNDNIEA